MNEQPNGSDVDAELEDISGRASAHIEPGRYRTSFRLFGELRRRAKQEQRIIPYLDAVFFQMDQAQYLLDPETMRERAVELISLLESEERARVLQPEFPDEMYAGAVYWMTACAYENLAEATGLLEGFNSDGMHACVADGLQVCRQTGKLQCINCFREYATDVYMAADDLAMARYQCQVVIDFEGEWPERGDRRWLASQKTAWLAMLNGDLGEARGLLEQALELSTAEDVALELEAKLRTYSYLASLALVAGLEPPAEMEDTLSEKPARDENPLHDWQYDLVDALQAACRQDFDTSIRILSDWDRQLTQQCCLHHWFETRLRLTAAHRLAGNSDRAVALGRQLEQRAQSAGDWLTMRRLERLLDESQPASPLAPLAPLSVGPFASQVAASTSAATGTSPEPAGDVEESPAAEPAAPLEAQREALTQRLQQAYEASDESMLSPILDDILAFKPEAVTDWRDAAGLIYLAQFVLEDCQRGEEAWVWANQIAALFDRQGTVVNVLADLGDTLRNGSNEALAERISKDRLEQLFRESLKLESKRAMNFLRAGDFFLRCENLGEAEWCFARGFRLERDNGILALRLAEVYRRTERPRDALNALDLCLREGGDEPGVAWEAAMTAYLLERFEPLLTYLDRYEELVPDELWTSYYRATALYELSQVEAAAEAIDEEVRRGQEGTFHLDALRTCIQLRLGSEQAAGETLQAVLDQPLATVDYLTIVGLANVLERLWEAAAEHLAGETRLQQLEERLLLAGMAPDRMFERTPSEEEVVDEVNYYRCLVRQTLDEDWAASPGCLAGQESWTHYFIEWGVLARNEKDAADLVLQWQDRCYRLPAAVEQIEHAAEDFEDNARVVWQGVRWGDPIEPEA